MMNAVNNIAAALAANSSGKPEGGLVKATVVRGPSDDGVFTLRLSGGREIGVQAEDSASGAMLSPGRKVLVNPSDGKIFIPVEAAAEQPSQAQQWAQAQQPAQMRQAAQMLLQQVQGQGGDEFVSGKRQAGAAADGEAGVAGGTDEARGAPTDGLAKIVGFKVVSEGEAHADGIYRADAAGCIIEGPSDGEAPIKDFAAVRLNTVNGQQIITVLTGDGLQAALEELRSGFESPLLRALPPDLLKNIFNERGFIDTDTLKALDAVLVNRNLSIDAASPFQMERIGQWLRIALDNPGMAQELVDRIPALGAKDAAGLLELIGRLSAGTAPESFFATENTLLSTGANAGGINLLRSLALAAFSAAPDALLSLVKQIDASSVVLGARLPPVEAARIAREIASALPAQAAAKPGTVHDAGQLSPRALAADIPQPQMARTPAAAVPQIRAGYSELTEATVRALLGGGGKTDAAVVGERINALRVAVERIPAAPSGQGRNTNSVNDNRINTNSINSNISDNRINDAIAARGGGAGGKVAENISASTNTPSTANRPSIPAGGANVNTVKAPSAFSLASAQIAAHRASAPLGDIYANAGGGNAKAPAAFPAVNRGAVPQQQSVAVGGGGIGASGINANSIGNNRINNSGINANNINTSNSANVNAINTGNINTNNSNRINNNNSNSANANAANTGNINTNNINSIDNNNSTNANTINHSNINTNNSNSINNNNSNSANANAANTGNINTNNISNNNSGSTGANAANTGNNNINNNRINANSINSANNQNVRSNAGVSVNRSISVDISGGIGVNTANIAKSANNVGGIGINVSGINTNGINANGVDFTNNQNIRGDGVNAKGINTVGSQNTRVDIGASINRLASINKSSGIGINAIATTPVDVPAIKESCLSIVDALKSSAAPILRELAQRGEISAGGNALLLEHVRDAVSSLDEALRPLVRSERPVPPEFYNRIAANTEHRISAEAKNALFLQIGSAQALIRSAVEAVEKINATGVNVRVNNNANANPISTNANANATVNTPISAITGVNPIVNHGINTGINNHNINLGINANIDTDANANGSSNINPGVNPGINTDVIIGADTNANPNINAGINADINPGINSNISPKVNPNVGTNINYNADLRVNANVNTANTIDANANIYSNANINTATSSINQPDDFLQIARRIWANTEKLRAGFSEAFSSLDLRNRASPLDKPADAASAGIVRRSADTLRTEMLLDVSRALRDIFSSVDELREIVSQLSSGQKALPEAEAAPLLRAVQALEHQARQSGTEVMERLKDVLRELNRLQADAARAQEHGGAAGGAATARSSPAETIRSAALTAARSLENLQLLSTQTRTAETEQQLLALPAKIGGEWTEVQIKFVKERKGEKGDNKDGRVSIYLNVAPSALGQVTAHLDYRSPNLKLSFQFEKPEVTRWFRQQSGELRESLSQAGLPGTVLEFHNKRPANKDPAASTQPLSGIDDGGIEHADGFEIKNGRVDFKI